MIQQMLDAFAPGGKIDSETQTLTNKTVSGAFTGDITGDLTGRASRLGTGNTPVNAVPAGTVTITFTDDSADTEVIDFGDDTYEIDLDAGGVTAGNIAIPLVTGSITKEDAAAAFETVFNASGTHLWTAVDQLDGTVELDPTAIVGGGVIGNGIVIDASGAAHASSDVATTISGVDGTPATIGTVIFNTTKLYVAVTAATIYTIAAWYTADLTVLS